MKNPWIRIALVLNLAVLLCGLALAAGGVTASYHEHTGMPGGNSPGSNPALLAALFSSSAVIICAGCLLILSAAFNFWTSLHLFRDPR